MHLCFSRDSRGQIILFPSLLCGGRLSGHSEQLKTETEELTTLLKEILFMCVVGLIPAQGTPVTLEGVYITFRLLELP